MKKSIKLYIKKSASSLHESRVYVIETDPPKNRQLALKLFGKCLLPLQ